MSKLTLVKMKKKRSLKTLRHHLRFKIKRKIHLQEWVLNLRKLIQRTSQKKDQSWDFLQLNLRKNALIAYQVKISHLKKTLKKKASPSTPLAKTAVTPKKTGFA